MSRRVGDLELEQDLGFQRREWTVQRIGWWALAGFVAAASLGLFGGGPLSRGRAGDAGAAVRIEYERFVRVGARSRLHVHFDSAPAGDDVREVRVNREYFDGIRLHSLSPEPERVSIGPEEVTFLFEARSVPAGSTLVVDMEPLSVGANRVSIGTDRGPAAAFAQFAYF